jgi:hypothetical protein
MKNGASIWMHHFFHYADCANFTNYTDVFEKNRRNPRQGFESLSGSEDGEYKQRAVQPGQPFACKLTAFYFSAGLLKGFLLCIKMGTTIMITIKMPMNTIPFVSPAWATSGMGVALIFPDVGVGVMTCKSIREGDNAMLKNENTSKTTTARRMRRRIFVSIILFTKTGDEVSPQYNMSTNRVIYTKSSIISGSGVHFNLRREVSHA